MTANSLCCRWLASFPPASYAKYFTPTVAAVEMAESHYSVGEGDGSVEVCVELTSLPAGGLECEISVTLDFNDGTKTREHY